jgi:fluoride exporter
VKWWALALGSLAGGFVRYLVSAAMPLSQMPAATFAVNMAGSFIIGLVMSLGGVWATPEMRLLIVTGFCGALTTFSTFMLEVSSLADASLGRALFYIGASLVCGFVLFRIGALAGRAL